MLLNRQNLVMCCNVSHKIDSLSNGNVSLSHGVGFLLLYICFYCYDLE